MQGYRYCWGPQVSRVFDFTWSTINHQSIVVITASEGAETTEGNEMIYSSASPKRFVGLARFTVDNISPYDGGVRFHITIDWNSPLTLWTDIIVFDDIPFGTNKVTHVG